MIQVARVWCFRSLHASTMVRTSCFLNCASTAETWSDCTKGGWLEQDPFPDCLLLASFFILEDHEWRTTDTQAKCSVIPDPSRLSPSSCSPTEPLKTEGSLASASVPVAPSTATAPETRIGSEKLRFAEAHDDTNAETSHRHAHHLSAYWSPRSVVYSGCKLLEKVTGLK